MQLIRASCSTLALAPTFLFLLEITRTISSLNNHSINGVIIPEGDYIRIQLSVQFITVDTACKEPLSAV